MMWCGRMIYRASNEARILAEMELPSYRRSLARNHPLAAGAAMRLVGEVLLALLLRVVEREPYHPPGIFCLLHHPLRDGSVCQRGQSGLSRQIYGRVSALLQDKESEEDVQEVRSRLLLEAVRKGDRESAGYEGLICLRTGITTEKRRPRLHSNAGRLSAEVETRSPPEW